MRAVAVQRARAGRRKSPVRISAIVESSKSRIWCSGGKTGNDGPGESTQLLTSAQESSAVTRCRRAIRMEQPPLNSVALQPSAQVLANGGGSASPDVTFHQPDGEPACELR